MAGDIFAVCDDANSGVNKMKFIFQARVPRILPLIQTKHRGERDDFICWKWRVRLYACLCENGGRFEYLTDNLTLTLVWRATASVTNQRSHIGNLSFKVQLLNFHISEIRLWTLLKVHSLISETWKFKCWKRWRGSATGRALDLRSIGRGFRSCSGQRCVTTLGKLFIPMCLCHQAV